MGQSLEPALCEQAHSAWIGPAVGLIVYRGRPGSRWPVTFSSITAERSSGHVPVACTIRSPRLSAVDKLFMDVDNIPVGSDFEAHLNSQVAACRCHPGRHRSELAGCEGRKRRNDGSTIRTISSRSKSRRRLPATFRLFRFWSTERACQRRASFRIPLKPLARRQAVHVRHTNFSSDAEALVKRLREALGYECRSAGGMCGRQSAWRPWQCCF